jgi:hypothetical protein
VPQRALDVVLLRPGTARSVSDLYRLGPSLEPGSLLPVGLLAVATAVKLASPHRAFVIDERLPVSGPGLRTRLRIVRPACGIVWVEPGTVQDATAAARLLREAGARRVLAAGPLPALRPTATDDLPEFDGNALGANALAHLIAEARGLPVRLSGGRFPDEGRSVDRRLLDYARYRIGDLPGPGSRVDGRDELLGERPAAEIVDDLRACASLGITSIELIDAAHLDRDVVASTLREHRFRGLRVGPAHAVAAAATGARVEVDLGAAQASDREGLASLGRAARSLPRGAAARASLLFGGGDPLDAEAGLREAGRLPIVWDAQVALDLPDGDALRAWMAAPRALPPGFDHRWAELAVRARTLLHSGTERLRGLRALAARALAPMQP